MPAKKVVNFIKLQIPAGQANPAPPVGPALGAAQVNIMQFCQAFNAATQEISSLLRSPSTKIVPLTLSPRRHRQLSLLKKSLSLRAARVFLSATR